jgi:hypothetical protein
MARPKSYSSQLTHNLQFLVGGRGIFSFYVINSDQKDVKNSTNTQWRAEGFGCPFPPGDFMHPSWGLWVTGQLEAAIIALKLGEQ